MTRATLALRMKRFVRHEGLTTLHSLLPTPYSLLTTHYSPLSLAIHSMTIYRFWSNGFYLKNNKASMPRAFNDREERQIRARLRKDGRKLFAARGVLKTSIEEIARSAGIAKGSFYKFYGSKELLFFELLEETQNEIRAPMLDETPGGARKTPCAV